MIRIPQAVLDKLNSQEMQVLFFMACQPKGGTTYSLVECAKAVFKRNPATRLLLVDFRLENRDLSNMTTTPGTPWQHSYKIRGSFLQRLGSIKEVPDADVLTSADSASPSLAALGDVITQLLLECSGKYDLVLFDFPPVLSNQVEAYLYRKSDGIILVVEAGNTRKPIIQEACTIIGESEGNLLGLILNKRKQLIPQWIYRRFF